MAGNVRHAADPINETLLPPPPTHSHVGVLAQLRFVLRRLGAGFAPAGAGSISLQDDDWVLVSADDGFPDDEPPSYEESTAAAAEFSAKTATATAPDHAPGATSAAAQNAASPAGVKRAAALALQAVEADSAGEADRARMLYIKAASCLRAIGSLDYDLERRHALRTREAAYIQRAEDLGSSATVSAGLGIGPLAEASAKPAGPVKRWQRLQRQAETEYRAAVCHAEDHEPRMARRLFIQSAELYTRAIKHAATERPDVVGLLHRSTDAALSAAETLDRHITPTYAHGRNDRGPSPTLIPLFSSSSGSRAAGSIRKQPPPGGVSPAPVRKPKRTQQQQQRQQQHKQQHQMGTGRQRSNGCVPRHWDLALLPADATHVNRTLRPDEQMYRAATSLFYKSVSPNEWKIEAIELLQHPQKWAAFCAKRAVLDDSLRAGAGETRAFHGTAGENVRTILAQGFLRDHNVTSAWGKGTYFAKNAQFSISNYTPADSDGLRYLFLARILVGEPCLGGPGKEIPDTKPGSDMVHESMVDTVEAPTLFVLGTGSDDHSYPELLLKIRKLTPD